MKTFLQYLREDDTPDPQAGDETWTDPAEWLPAYHSDWCREHPGHPDCAQFRELRAANTQDLKELPGAAGEAAHKRLHTVISGILKKHG